MKSSTIRGGRHTTVERYGYEFIAARARNGLLARELAKVARPDRLTSEEIDAVYRQVMRRQAAKMRAAKAATRTAAAAAERSAQVDL